MVRKVGKIKDTDPESWPKITTAPYIPEVGQRYEKVLKIADKRFKEPVFRMRPVEYKYRDVPFDKEGWVSSSTHLPERFDLVVLKILREMIPLKKILNGWWDGNNWDGLRVKKLDKVTHWKRVAHVEML